VPSVFVPDSLSRLRRETIAAITAPMAANLNHFLIAMGER